MSQKKLPKSIPEATLTVTYRELAGSSYIVLQDGSVATLKRLKPKVVGKSRHWFLSHQGHLKSVSQKKIDGMTSFP